MPTGSDVCFYFTLLNHFYLTFGFFEGDTEQYAYHKLNGVKMCVFRLLKFIFLLIADGCFQPYAFRFPVP